jgi:hypothetical protein
LEASDVAAVAGSGVRRAGYDRTVVLVATRISAGTGPSYEDLASDRRNSDDVDRLLLLTVGHGTLHSEELVQLLGAKRVQLVVDVRSVPGSRRHPQFGRAEMERWLPAAHIDYRWEPDLAGFRGPVAGSVNTALRHPSFRGYADYMATDRFRAALRRLLDDSACRWTAVMCAES